METDSASTTSVSAPSTPTVWTGSGSHGPTYSSRRRAEVRSAFNACRVTTRAR